MRPFNPIPAEIFSPASSIAFLSIITDIFLSTYIERPLYKKVASIIVIIFYRVTSGRTLVVINSLSIII